MSTALHLPTTPSIATSPSASRIHECPSAASAHTPQRSTRGASKQRRDQINVEIQRLRDLLPLSESIKDRLFQLQVMSLGCIYIRKHRYQKHSKNRSSVLNRCDDDKSSCACSVLRTISENSIPLPKGLDACKALRGFLIMLNRSGKLLHVSDNASEYLGHSIEEIMCQGDSIFDLVDPRDHPTVQTELNSGPQPTTSFPEERVFLCRLNLARTAKRQLQYHKFVLLQGRYIHPAEYFQSLANTPDAAQPIFAAYCQPVINPENAETLSSGNTDVFTSQHYLDMTFKEVDHMCAHHLGYGRDELKGMSWYSLLHPAHIPEVAYKHRLLCQEKEGSVLALIKMRTASGAWIWLHTVFAVRGNLSHEQQDGRRVRHVIHCYYQTLSGIEAATLQANSWIYNMRHTYPAAFPCQESPTPDRPLSPVSPFPVESSFPQTLDQLVPFIKQEPFNPMTMVPHYGISCGQIKVEIPMKTMPHISMFTPESSSPESSASLTSALFSQPFFSGQGLNDSSTTMDDFNCILPLTIKGALPDLRDGLDDFFREVEQPAERSAGAVAPITSTASISHSPEQATELFKYLGPALFGPTAQSNNGESSPVTDMHCSRKRSWVV
ncbi:hypothetical protein Y032_0163g3479 [Ancylostoma ceylanicum]|uniref:BHLH domain-containing protein n=1 Tax=Ancylostoma ceylanicum TaxID=53326 RepID=A0A016SWR1_9BILA|nr:hypothetical protein Y032_0163g3479 [Ancylostoma ceylanicum]